MSSTEEDEVQQKLLKRTTVASGADTTLLAKVLANSKEPEHTPERTKSYDERMARLQAAFEARKKKLEAGSKQQPADGAQK